MKKKRIFKWLFGLFLTGLLVVIACFLLRDTFACWAVQRTIEHQTHIKTRIGSFHIGLGSVTMKDLKMYNPPAYGGTLFLAIPEVHFEFDRDAAVSKNELHLTLVRFNLGEIDIVKNEAGQTNLFALGLALPTKDDLIKSKDSDEIKKRTGLKFTGIDLLQVSVGTARYIDLADQKNNRDQKIDMQDVPVPNVKSAADLAGLLVLITLRSDNFFTRLVGPAGLN